MQQLFSQLAGALGIDDADDGEDEQPLPHGKHRGRELADGFLLLPDDPLALLDEPDTDGDGDPVRGRLVGVLHPVQERHVRPVLLEQLPGQHVAEQEHDPEHLVRLDAAGDDALGEVPGVGLERLHAARLQRLEVAVVDGAGLGEDLLLGHRGEELSLDDVTGPLVAQGRPLFAQVGNQLAEQ